MHYLAVCCIAKDENPNIKEWLAYHAAMGAEHFYVYDNMSEEPVLGYIEGFADENQVTCKRINGQGMQMAAYAHCLENFGNDCRWIAFIDIDEFIHLEDGEGDDLRAFLAEYEQYAALALNWKLFSSSGRLGRPEGLVMENYTHHLYHSADNMIIKCVVQPRRVKSVVNPHVFLYADGFYAVNADHAPAPRGGTRCVPAYGRARVHHYQFKSQRDYEDKQRRGRADRPRGEADFPYERFYTQAAAPWREDLSISRRIPAVRAMLDRNRLVVSRPAYEPEDLVANLAETLLRDTEDFKATEIYLCHAAMHYEDAPEVWRARSYIWRCRGKLQKAFSFAGRGLQCSMDGALYQEYFYLCAMLGKWDKAAGILELAQFLCDRNDKRSLEELNKMKKLLTESLRRKSSASVAV